MVTKQSKKAQRTQAIINHYRGLPGEFYMLKGLLCLDIAVEEFGSNEGAKEREREAVARRLDLLLIAQRMDALQAEGLGR